MEKYLISEAFNNLKQQKILMESKPTRQQLIDDVDNLYQKLYDFDSKNVWKVEDILNRNNASEDDSDPNEGFFKTMSDKDLENAYNAMKALLPQITIEQLLNELRDAVAKIDNNAILDFDSTDDGFVIKTTSGDYEFTIKPVELDDNSISYTDDDFSDY